MKNIKHFVSLSFCALTLCANLNASDAVIDNTAEARKLMSEAAKHYNKAVAAIQHSDGILRDNINRAANMSQEFVKHRDSYDTIVKKLEDANDKMRILREAYKQGASSIAFAKENLSFAGEKFPVGEKRFELADRLYKDGLEIVTKNPGRNYEDKIYFESVWNSYMRFKVQFNSRQKEASKLALTLSIANPRMEGIDATLKLAQDFLEKTSKTADENKGVSAEMRQSVASLYEESVKAYEVLTEELKKLAEMRSTFTKSNFALSSFIMNELPKHEKYGEIIFNADAHYLNAVQNVQTFAREQIKEGKARVYNDTRGSLLEQTDGAWQRPSVTAPSGTLSRASGTLSADTMSAPESPKNVREELFNIALKITNLTAEIAQAHSLLSDIVFDAQASLGAVERCENDANALLRSALGFFTEAQTNASELQIFKNSLAVTMSQSKISSNEFKKLCENSDTSIKACSDNTLNGLKKLETAKTALK